MLLEGEAWGASLKAAAKAGKTPLPLPALFSGLGHRPQKKVAPSLEFKISTVPGEFLPANAWGFITTIGDDN